MNEEKVLSYLNINKDNKNDKSLPKLCFGFNLGVTLFILLFEILLFHPSNCYIYISFGVFDVIYLISCITYKKPWWQFPLAGIGEIILMVKTFFAYKITSQFEFVEAQIPSFTGLHIAVLVLAIGAILYVLAKFYQAYNILKNNALSSAKKKIASKNRMPAWIALIAPLSASPMILVRLLRDDFEDTGLGIGFALWSLGLVFAVLFAWLLPKLIVFFHYRVWTFSDFQE